MSISVHLRPFFLTSDFFTLPFSDFVQLLVCCSVCLNVPETTIKQCVAIILGDGYIALDWSAYYYPLCTCKCDLAFFTCESSIFRHDHFKLGILLIIF